MSLIFDRQFNDKEYAVIGVDEAGRGALCGPVVVAAVRLFRSIPGLNDSKKLSPKKRQELLPLILANSCWAVISIPPSIIDQINILGATKLGMRRVAARVLRHSTGRCMVLIDGNQPLNTFEYEQTVVKGDSKSEAIAAASIIAKEHRDKIVTRLAIRYPEYRFADHKGYGTVAHYDALEKFGPSPVHRTSFRLTKKRKKEQLNFFG
ncbi:ribonuclease HII [bacterium]|nr:ribonuclease HII [bacterium]